MKDYQGSAWFKKALQAVIGLTLAGMLASCGGGGGGDCVPTEFGKPCDTVASPPPSNEVPDATVKSDGIPVGINFVNSVPADKSIVKKGSGGNGRTEVAILTFKVVDKAGVGVPDKLVTFKTDQSVTLAVTSGKTEKDGTIAVSVSSGTVATTVRVVATTAGANGMIISSLSDQLTVTTGEPAYFSIARKHHNVEGWNTDNVLNEITVNIADQDGQAVADGTPVVFTVDSGLIFNPDANDARCLTKNAQCTVQWRSAEPRNNAGLVTVTASTSNSNGALIVDTSFISSGSFVEHLTILGADRDGRFSLGNSCEPQSLVILIQDINKNALPPGTTVKVGSSTNVTASVPLSESTVPDTMAKGTYHSITVTAPATCKDTGATNGQTGSLSLIVTTPLNNLTKIPVELIGIRR